MYTLVMTINHHYCECDHKYNYVQIVEQETLESHSKKQDKASSTTNLIAFQNCFQYISAVLFAKLLLSQFLNSLFPALKKQSSFLQEDILSKLANNSKLISDKYKKRVDNNLCFYYKIRDYKLDSKKQFSVTSKSHSTQAATTSATATVEKSSEK